MTEDRSFERHFRALHGGDATFDEFARATAPLWRKLAAQVHRRWRMPAWHTQEETVQNFLLAAWQFTWAYEPTRGRSIQRFVVWNAYDKAKKAAHRARRAPLHGNPDRAPSSIERPLSSYGQDGADDGEQSGVVERLMFQGGAYSPATQEQRLIDAEERQVRSVRAWSCAESDDEAAALEALALEPTVEDAARRLAGDPEVRVRLRIDTVEDAHDLMLRAASAVTRRVVAA